jgi:hypothetical protein
MRSRSALLGALVLAAASAAAAAPAIDASLTDAEAKARKREATVQVVVTGVQMVDPASVQEKPRAGQGHLHYRVDDGPVIATTSTKLSFHDLARGEHRIEVTLAGNDHEPLLPPEQLRVTVPGDAHEPH